MFDECDREEQKEYEVERHIISKKYYTVRTKKICWDWDTSFENYDCMDTSIGEASKNSYMHIFKDITNAEKLKAEKTLMKYQRLMLSSVAHEFRNPLNAIKGNLELMEIMTENKYEKYIKV